MSVASTGLSLGGVILTPLSAVMVESLGFKIAAPLIGVIFLVGVVPVAWMYLRESPESMGLHVDGDLPESIDESVTSDPPQVIEGGITFKEARRRKFFWGVSLAYIFLMAAQVGGIAHQYGLARELLTEAETAIAVAILPVFSIIGRLIGGWIVDRMSIRKFAISMMILQAASLSLLAGGFGIFTLFLGLAAFGATVGNLLMLQPLLIADAFGVKDYARIFSVSNLMSSWGTAMGPGVLGFVYATSGSLYQLPYFVAAGAGALGIVLFLMGGKIVRSHA